VQNSQKGGPHSTSKQGGPRRPPHLPPLISLPEYYWIWTVEDDMVDGLFCATLTGRRGGHTPFSQAGAETSDTGAEEELEQDPSCSWEGHSGCVCTGVWN